MNDADMRPVIIDDDVNPSESATPKPPPILLPQPVIDAMVNLTMNIERFMFQPFYYGALRDCEALRARVHELETAALERDVLAQRSRTLEAEMQALRQERDTLRQERDSLTNEHRRQLQEAILTFATQLNLSRPTGPSS